MSKRINQAIVFTSNLQLVEAIHAQLSIVAVILERRHFNPALYDFSRLRGFPVRLADTPEELDSQLDSLESSDLGISFGFSLKFDDEVRESFRFGIWNIHPGSLPENRGRHPITWDFLENSDRFTVVIHEVDNYIDRGYLLAAHSFDRRADHTFLSVQNEMIAAVKKNLLAQAIENYFSGGKVPIGPGNYRKPIGKRLREINPQSLDALEIYNTIMSQADHGGVAVGRRVFTKCTFVYEPFSHLYDGYYFVRSRDGNLMGLN